MKVALWAFLASICLPLQALASIVSSRYCFELGWVSVMTHEDDCRVGQHLLFTHSLARCNTEV